jgi:hypothetical protein
VLGSNAFDVALLFVADLAYRKDSASRMRSRPLSLSRPSAR